MRHLSRLALILSTLAACEAAAPGGEDQVDKTVEVRCKDGKLSFVERGKEKAEVVTLVVGQTIRWENKGPGDLRLVSALKVDDKPIFDTGAIKPGEHKDLTVDIDLYRKAGGKPANVVKLKYHDQGREAETADLQVLSAARRGIGRPRR